MFFYRIEAEILNYDSKMCERRYEGYVSDRTEYFFNKNKYRFLIFIASVNKNRIIAGAVSEKICNTYERFSSFIKDIGIECENTEVNEVTWKEFKNILQNSRYNSYISDYEDKMQRMGIDSLMQRYVRVSYYEKIAGDIKSKDEIIKGALKLPCGDTLAEEIERIYEKPAKEEERHHPVHYMIHIDDGVAADSTFEYLMSALYSNRRIKSRRYAVINIEKSSFDDEYEDAYNELFVMSEDGAVVISCNTEAEEESESLRHGITGKIIKICEYIRKYKNRVLIIFRIPVECKILKDKIYENIPRMSFVEINEEALSFERAKEYLKEKAANNHIAPDEELYTKINNKDMSFRAAELNDCFDIWYDKKLKTEIFPQYSKITCARTEEMKEKPKGNAYEELMSMVGLKNSKEIINDAIKFYKVQKVMAAKGRKTKRKAMHMVFTGNPGTAKTTVARLLARILKDNGVLSVGDFYELGRADLVGRYVGWTAKTVKEKFAAAKGSVMLIDEAYSLIDDRRGSYGDEAIDTIVQEMENNREDMVVIFAGYPKEMETFLNRNSGLRSRIAYHINFDDYNANELYEIAELMAKKEDMHLDAGVKEKLMADFENAVKKENFGNGRYVRNIIEKAQMKQGSRIADMDFDSITDKELSLLKCEDFELENEKPAEMRRKIGFSLQ